MLLGVRVVIAVSYERIHRSNLVGMGILPLQFPQGQTWQSLGLTGEETFEVLGLDDNIKPRSQITVRATAPMAKRPSFRRRCASIHRSRSITTAMAESCKRCFASWPPSVERDGVGGASARIAPRTCRKSSSPPRGRRQGDVAANAPFMRFRP